LPDRNLESLRDTVITWQSRRVKLAENFTQDSLRGFAEGMNYLTRQLIAAFETDDPDFYSALMELAQNAGTLTSKAKLIVNKVDRTNL
jgi:hypothetical protein